MREHAARVYHFDLGHLLPDMERIGFDVDDVRATAAR
jgi:hypothetical protein